MICNGNNTCSRSQIKQITEQWQVWISIFCSIQKTFDLSKNRRVHSHRIKTEMCCRAMLNQRIRYCTQSPRKFSRCNRIIDCTKRRRCLDCFDVVKNMKSIAKINTFDIIPNTRSIRQTKTFRTLIMYKESWRMLMNAEQFLEFIWICERFKCSGEIARYHIIEILNSIEIIRLQF